MSRHKAGSEIVRRLLQNDDLRVMLDAPEGDYRVEYYTTTIKDAGADAPRRVRTYRLVDLFRGGITQEPWERYDLDKQTTLVTNLMEFGGYRVSKVVAGWKVQCPACGHLMRGKIWESVPTICARKGPPRCRQKLTDDDICEEAHAAR